VRSARRNHYQSFRGGRQRQQRRRVERSDRGLDAVELSDAGERYCRPYRRGRLHARAYQRLSIHAARRRDRWRRRLLAHAVDVLGQPTLTEFRGCAGSGVVAKGLVNLTLGGIEIAKAGNLLTLDIVGASGSGALDVYRGCNPRCKLVSSNALKNPAYFGHLNANGDRLAVGAFLAGQVDIYSYSPKKLKYLYGFDEGLSLFDDVLGVTYK
jgi:hypothetical protein